MKKPSFELLLLNILHGTGSVSLQLLYGKIGVLQNPKWDG
jgi:hypothetical protein